MKTLRVSIRVRILVRVLCIFLLAFLFPFSLFSFPGHPDFHSFWNTQTPPTTRALNSGWCFGQGLESHRVLDLVVIPATTIRALDHS